MIVPKQVGVNIDGTLVEGVLTMLFKKIDTGDTYYNIKDLLPTIGGLLCLSSAIRMLILGLSISNVVLSTLDTSLKMEAPSF